MATYADEQKKYANWECWCWYFSHGGQITGKGRGHRASSLHPPHPTTLPSSTLISNAILPVLCSPFFPTSFPKHNSPVTGFQLQLLLVSLLSEKSTSLEPSYQNLLQQGCWLKLSGVTCGADGAGRGDVNVGLICRTFE